METDPRLLTRIYNCLEIKPKKKSLVFTVVPYHQCTGCWLVHRTQFSFKRPDSGVLWPYAFISSLSSSSTPHNSPNITRLAILLQYLLLSISLSLSLSLSWFVPSHPILAPTILYFPQFSLQETRFPFTTSSNFVVTASCWAAAPKAPRTIVSWLLHLAPFLLVPL